MHPSLRVVIGRLPDVGERAVYLFEHDESFRELCEEYDACSSSVTRLDASGHSPQGLRNEYAALLLRLEGELLRYMEAHPNG